MNRKQCSLTLFVAIISGFLGGALSVWFLMPPSVLAQDGPGKQTIEAERFVLKDAQGRMRAELTMLPSQAPVLWFYDVAGEKVTTLVEGGIMFDNPGSSTSSYLYSGGASIKDSEEELLLVPGSLMVLGDTPTITITDDEGFQAVLGSTSTVETRTGKTNQTSAASLILFGKDKKVIWSAP